VNKQLKLRDFFTAVAIAAGQHSSCATEKQAMGNITITNSIYGDYPFHEQ